MYANISQHSRNGPCALAIFADKKMNEYFNESTRREKPWFAANLVHVYPRGLVFRHVGARKRRFLENTRRSRRQIYFNRIIIISRNPERSIAPSWRSWLKVESSREQSNRTEPNPRTWGRVTLGRVKRVIAREESTSRQRCKDPQPRHINSHVTIPRRTLLQVAGRDESFGIWRWNGSILWYSKRKGERLPRRWNKDVRKILMRY